MEEIIEINEFRDTDAHSFETEIDLEDFFKSHAKARFVGFFGRSKNKL
jgi:hypothetical protein